MRRQILGVIVATIAAPYLTMLLVSTYMAFNDVVTFRETFDPLGILKFIPLGTVGLVFFGIPLLIFSSICAVLLHAFECRTKWVPILLVTHLGFCFAAVALSSPANIGDEILPVLAIGSLPGAICGWIYWRIALAVQ